MMKYDLPPLPIHAVLPELRKSLANHRSVVLAAEPGSGKTTIVPLVLVNEPWLAGRKIIILEPRRLAARMAAKRMSELAGDTVGGLVGYRIRFDRKISSETRIEVVTEGILTRMIQRDPELAGVGLVVFDEFHERSLQSDLALALCLDVLTLRDDLKIMIMSATMDTFRVSRLLGGAPVISGKGRCFPVTLNYLSCPPTDFLIQRTVKAIRRAMAEQNGDILVFLPGAGEIRAVQNRIDGDVLCLPLYGNLPQKKQDLIFDRAEKRRLILATPIAETSLTIEGVSVVIDSGLMKVPRFSPATGLTSLHTISISKASADQRAGRAGRLGPGICYRLWTMGEHHSKADFLPPEIIGADLAPLLLEVLLWGVNDPGELTWLDPPRTGQVNQARDLLARLGAVDEKGGLTEIGRQIASLPLHPRLALMLLRGREQGNGPLACRLAALLQNRDPFRGSDGAQSVDIEDRLDILRLFEQKGQALVRARGADPSLCHRILREADQYQHFLGIDGGVRNFQESGNLLALAYPDRIAMKKPGSSQHLLSSGRGVILPVGDHLHQADFLVAAHVDGGKKQGRIFLGAALSREKIIGGHGHLLSREDRVVWNKNKVEAASVLLLGKLEMTKEPLSEVDPYKISQCLLEGIKQTGIDCLGWQKKSREVQARMQCAHVWNPDRWPDVSDTNLMNDLSWIEPYLDSITTLKQLKNLDLYPILHSLLSWQKQQELDRVAPTHFQVPSGSKKRLLYQPGEPPILAVRLQEMFGATATPTVFDGKIPVLVHLLSPAGRAIQVTLDLVGFWQNTYHEVKKELKGRYPKHYWPDDPIKAQAIRGVKRKRKG
ncbi:MAG: ATP-dependent helicase HrpB [Desulfobulbaceae bacterium]|nr:ATP-dependent helicase HrpB [Desulfobulbaceae bacterium]